MEIMHCETDPLAHLLNIHASNMAKKAKQEVGSYLGKCAIERNGPKLGPSALHVQLVYDHRNFMNESEQN